MFGKNTETLTLECAKKSMSPEKYAQAVEYMKMIRSDPSIPRMIKVFYKKDYLGLVYGNDKTALKEAVKLFRCFKMNKDKEIIPDNFKLDDSCAWNYVHMMG